MIHPVCSPVPCDTAVCFLEQGAKHSALTARSGPKLRLRFVQLRAVSRRCIVFVCHRFTMFRRPARGLVGSASASVLVGREFSALGRVSPRPYNLVLWPSCQAHDVRKSCSEHIIIPSKLQPAIVQTQSWCHETIAVIKRQQQTTI